MLKRLGSIFLLLSVLNAFAQIPTATIIVPSATICTDNSIILNSSVTNAPTSYSWTLSPASGVNILSSTSQNSLGILFSNAGVYSVSLTVSNISGTSTATQTLNINATPRASFSASLNAAGYPAQLILTNFSSGAGSYIWSYSETVAVDNTTDAVHSYTAGGAYSVTLTALNSNGCIDSETYSFYIEDSSGITLPNVFTPNGDGINDVFKPIARGISDIKVNIYSRFGNLVASWDKPGGHWDGHTPSGMACETGTYFCVVQATGFDGKTYKLNVFISLFRNQ